MFRGHECNVEEIAIVGHLRENRRKLFLQHFEACDLGASKLADHIGPLSIFDAGAAKRSFEVGAALCAANEIEVRLGIFVARYGRVCVVHDETPLRQDVRRTSPKLNIRRNCKLE
jgi:hypothetical protein